ncbi:MFS transporter [Pseudonocardia sp. CA-107938]|uniref:MFS transporter n=1 Tax=Pseudonocardia sp. CA-107938 TaxID=3240021 RepID=UPI003D90315E
MRTWWPLVAVCLGSAVFLLDTTVVTVALPAIGRDLGVPVATLEWVAGGYPLVLAVLVPSAGAIADRVGQRRAYLAGCAVFAAASLGCALAPTAAALVAARIAQGVGGAALAVGGFALLAASYTEPRRRTALGVFFAVNGLAAALGPVVGGLLTDGAGWRWVFALNLPLLAATAVATRAIAATPGRPGGRFDVVGTALFALAAGAATAGLTRAAESADLGTVGLLVVAALAGAAFVAVERRRDGVLDVGLLATAGFGGAIAAAAATSIVFAALLYTSVAVQEGLDPAAAGLALAPFAVASAVTSTVVRRVPPWAAVGGGLLVIAAGCLALDANLTVGLVVSGIGFGVAAPAVASAVLSAAPPERAGAASAAMATARQLGQVLGIGVLGVVYAAGGTAPVGVVAAALTATAGATALRVLRPHPAASRTTLR